MLPQYGVVSLPGQAGGEALARSPGLQVVDADVAVTWCISAAMSLKGISAL
jgi:ABC-type iron transport system FetAB permease component